MLKTALLLLSLGCAPALANTEMTTPVDVEPFKKTLKSELTNRATARYAITAITTQDLEPTARLFWQSYAELEVLNQERYTPVAAELQLKHGTLLPWLKGRSAAVYYRVAPERMLKTMAKATDSYYQELRNMTAKVAAQYSAFYQYVLEQERAQVEAFALAATGDYQGASERLNDFIQAQRPPAL